MNVAEFSPAPEGTERVRAIIWYDGGGDCGQPSPSKKAKRGVVRVFADIGRKREPRLIWEGPFRDSDDPVLEKERHAAAKFYGAR